MSGCTIEENIASEQAGVWHKLEVPRLTLQEVSDLLDSPKLICLCPPEGMLIVREKIIDTEVPPILEVSSASSGRSIFVYAVPQMPEDGE